MTYKEMQCITEKAKEVLKRTGTYSRVTERLTEVFAAASTKHTLTEKYKVCLHVLTDMLTDKDKKALSDIT